MGGILEYLSSLLAALLGLGRTATALLVESRKQTVLLTQIRDSVVPLPAVSLRVDIIGGDLSPKEGISMVTLKDTQQVDLSVNPLDSKKKPAAIDGAVSFVSTDETIATVVVGADGKTATVVAQSPGSCQINLSADADLGAGVTAITDVVDVVVVAGDAVTLGATVGTPVDQPAS